MRIIEMNGAEWRTEADFYDALARALGSFPGHGRNADAFEETMIYYLDLNYEQPPYRIVIHNAPKSMRGFLQWFAGIIVEARKDRIADPNWGDDVEVSVAVSE